MRHRPPDAAATAALQGLLDVYAGRGNVPGIALFVGSPRLGIDFTGAAGVADRATGAPLRPGTPFRIASNTKTHVAAAMLRLVERGRLTLDTALAGLLPKAYLTVLRDGGYDPGAMTVRMLAWHTSGLRDYAQTEEYFAVVLGDRGRRWTRLEQVRFAMALGPPVGMAGERFAYADTGYILLGQIIEDLSRQPLAAALRSLLRFDELGLSATYLESLEEAPPGLGERARIYLGEDDVSTIDPSFDLYGGGGLVAPVADLGRFYQALFAGRVFDRAETLAQMLALAPVEAGFGVGMGLFGQGWHGFRCWQHTGYWGSLAVACPEIELTIGLMLFQATVSRESGIGEFSKRLADQVRARIGAGAIQRPPSPVLPLPVNRADDRVQPPRAPGTRGRRGGR
ncbi:MAG: beta-lactamase family protein [Chloroflexota bacterium]|nr:beta-lactamase family protein [Chloroflexota bacterium]